ncbi:MAG: hypothetical protein CEN92_28 [Candidatus Berkelbacteria bacterium Licking1014_96]|uniref:Uncharacterized protein n=1 Tax=Candidatus Berkelbacteria bacterium Licking1014_96 TaxID=2017149 RepID=A0A554LHG9_9BACT|nr:MAG: hypothetical protein CEN92_28 [Candidatus Berkelbacteria bacterium Licking1014_96]
MAEEIKTGPDLEKPKGHIRGIWATLIIIIVALLVIGGVGWYFYKTDPVQFAGLFNWQKASTPTPTSTATATPSSTGAGSDNCALPELTFEEKAITTGWKTHTNTAGKFEFKYPAEWTVTNEYVDMVAMKDSTDSNVTFEFGRAESGTIDTTGYKNTGSTLTKVWCLDATEKHYEKGSSSPLDYLVVVSFERSGIPNILVYNFKAIGASSASDYVDQFNALVKTFKFLP